MFRKKSLSPIGLAVAAALANSAAVAQQAPMITKSPALPSPSFDESQGYFFNLQPIGRPLGEELANHGVYITGRTINEGFSDVSGGLKRGTLYEGFTLLGVDLDMNRIAGINGGILHVLFNDLNGIPFAPYSGSQYGYNRVFGAPASARLNEFSWEQRLFDNKLDIRIGRVPIGSQFDFSNVYCEFVSGICALPAGYAFTKGYPSYLAASWSAIAQVRLPSNFYLNAGIFEDQPSITLVNHPGLPGEDWAPDKARGATIPVQLGYRERLATTAYPKAFSIGAFYDTGDYTDPYYNSAGETRALNGGAPRLDHGKSQVWFQGQQVVWRPDPTNDRALTIFGGANVTTSGDANINQAAFLGMSLRGPFDPRPNDTFNVVAQYIGLNNTYIDNVNLTLAKQGIQGELNQAEGFFEVNYGICLSPGTYLKPFLDYMVNPDQVGIAKPNPSDTHALFIGAAFTAVWSDALGLPRLGDW